MGQRWKQMYRVRGQIVNQGGRVPWGRGQDALRFRGIQGVNVISRRGSSLEDLNKANAGRRIPLMYYNAA